LSQSVIQLVSQPVSHSVS